MPSPRVTTTSAPGPKLAILFWFYKDIPLCRERLDGLRRLNRGVSIFGLYGGPQQTAEAARAALGARLDDFWAYPEDRTPDWRYRNGDQLISAWHEARGRHLSFDTVIVVQWDMLMLSPIKRVFADLKTGEALFSGARPISETAGWWGWAGAKDDGRADELERFKALIKTRYDWRKEPWACLFIVVALPRCFLDRYAEEGASLTGFLEYKLPTLAQIFGVPLKIDRRFDPWWAADPQMAQADWSVRSLNAIGLETPRRVVLQALADPRGRRVFHPVFKPFPRILVWPPAARCALFVLGLRDLLTGGTRYGRA